MDESNWTIVERDPYSVTNMENNDTPSPRRKKIYKFKQIEEVCEYVA